MKILKTRAKTHGDYVEVARIAQELKRVMRTGPNWGNLPSYMQESLELDATKTARILCGSAYEPDHWHDKAGYATLVEGLIQ
jgi:4-hydroxy-3-methylbut-2-en-1-yl diphosphate synthase IspG/GcpE